MNSAHDAVEAALSDIKRLRQRLKKGKGAQVRSAEEKSIVKATALAWFNNYREIICELVDEELLHEPDNLFKEIISASDHSTSRTVYDNCLKKLSSELPAIREYTLTPKQKPSHTADTPPDFKALVPDPKMRSILERRWHECVNCINASAPLAATVMMGGLLEALLLAKVHREPNKSTVFSSSKAPKDKVTGKTKPLNEWALRNYIDVAHDLEWITSSAKDVGEVVRDYRNYVHPYKELSHGVNLEKSDAILFWEISKNIARQLL